MRIDGSIPQITDIDFNNNTNKVNVKTTGETFEQIFNAALDLYNDTNKFQIDAEQLQLDYVTGKTDDIIALNMAQVKASTSLQFTTQVTNKILTAYQEIMRMSL